MRQTGAASGLQWYSPLAFHLSNMLVAIPFALLAVLPMTLILYFMVNFAADAGRFFFFLLCAWAMFYWPSG